MQHARSSAQQAANETEEGNARLFINIHDSMRHRFTLGKRMRVLIKKNLFAIFLTKYFFPQVFPIQAFFSFYILRNNQFIYLSSKIVYSLCCHCSGRSQACQGLLVAAFKYCNNEKKATLRRHNLKSFAPYENLNK